MAILNLDDFVLREIFAYLAPHNDMSRDQFIAAQRQYAAIRASCARFRAILAPIPEINCLDVDGIIVRACHDHDMGRVLIHAPHVSTYAYSICHCGMFAHPNGAQFFRQVFPRINRETRVIFRIQQAQIWDAAQYWTKEERDDIMRDYRIEPRPANLFMAIPYWETIGMRKFLTKYMKDNPLFEVWLHIGITVIDKYPQEFDLFARLYKESGTRMPSPLPCSDLVLEMARARYIPITRVILESAEHETPARDADPRVQLFSHVTHEFKLARILQCDFSFVPALTQYFANHTDEQFRFEIVASIINKGSSWCYNEPYGYKMQHQNERSFQILREFKLSPPYLARLGTEVCDTYKRLKSWLPSTTIAGRFAFMMCANPRDANKMIRQIQLHKINLKDLIDATFGCSTC